MALIKFLLYFFIMLQVKVAIATGGLPVKNILTEEEFKETQTPTEYQKFTTQFDEIVLAVVSAVPESTRCLMNGIAKAIAEEMNIPITLVYLPAKRIPIMLKQGRIHGDFSRLDGYLSTYPSLLKVITPVSKIHYFAYSLKSKSVAVTGWDSLKKYEIALPRGYSLYNKYLIGQNVHFLDSEKATFKFLNAGRADLIVSDAITARTIIQSESPAFDNIQQVGPSLGYMSFHTYISPQYPEIVKYYNEALKKLVETQKYKELFSMDKCL